MALGHTILIIVYYILMRRGPYRELGVTYFDDRNPQRVERRLVRRLERMGYVVSLEPPLSLQPAALDSLFSGEFPVAFRYPFDKAQFDFQTAVGNLKV